MHPYNHAIMQNPLPGLRLGPPCQGGSNGSAHSGQLFAVSGLLLVS
jgi:hypothetical protein